MDIYLVVKDQFYQYVLQALFQFIIIIHYLHYCEEMNKIAVQQFEDSYDQAKITLLKKTITLSKTELFQLVNDDNAFTEKLKYFNKEGCVCIQKEEFYQAIVYLNQAQLTLQYGASCGKTIERSLILITLHNLASVYQRIWELQKSADYIEGIIYNITSFIDGEEIFKLREQILDDKSTQSQRINSLLQSKQKLVRYYLQFCAVSSQLKRHQNSLNAASKSLDILKQICQELHEYQIFKGMKYYNELQKGMLQQLRNIKDFKQENADIDKNIERFMNKAKKSIGMFQKKIKFNYNILDQKEKDQLHQFSIGAIMQIYPQESIQNGEKKSLKEQLTPKSKIYKALYISIAHFTMATELRLIVNSRYGLENNSKKATTQFKSSQLHHLIAIITVALYVPYETLYFEHILNSFKNHYQIDLSIITQSIFSQQMSHSIQSDDGIHLQLSSMYKKKPKIDQSTCNQKNKATSQLNHITASPTIEIDSRFQNRSKQKIKTSKMSVDKNKQHNSIKIKCKMITDSQGRNKQIKNKNTVKSNSKRSKSKKKSQCSKGKQSLQSPIPKQSINLNQRKGNPPSSKSKPKVKSKSNPKYKGDVADKKKDKSQINMIRSQHEYGFKTSHQKITKIQRHKKSLRSSQRRFDYKKSDNEKMSGTDIRFIRNGKSPIIPMSKGNK